MTTLDMEHANKIAETIQYRQDHFDGEDLHTSIMVVLLNYGSHTVPVTCVGQEWSGVKGDLEPRDGVPLCPNGHPLIETGPGMRLGLVNWEIA